MANDQNGNGMTFRKTAIWFGAISALFVPAACVQIAGIDPPIFDPNVNNGGMGGSTSSSQSSSGSGGMAGAGPCTENEFKSCYSGPPGTENVGICKSGTTICLFGNFQPCTSDTTPDTEDCATEEDEDCDGKMGAVDEDCALPSNWVYAFGTPMPAAMDDAMFAITPTMDGGYLAGGVVNGLVGADNASVSSGDGYVVKFNAAGQKVWEQKLSADAMSYAVVRGLAEDAAGAVIAVGGFSGGITVGGTKMTALGTDGFIVKISPDGNIVKSQAISGGSIQSINAVTADANNNIFIAGTSNGQVDFGGGMSPAPMAQDIFIASYDVMGVLRWAKLFVNPGAQQARAIALNPGVGPEIIVAGITNNIVNMGGVELPHSGGQDIVLARYTLMAGDHTWSKSYGDGSDQDVRAIAVDSNKNILLTGEFEGTIDWGGSSLTNSSPKTGAYAVKLNPQGEFVNGIAPGLNGKSLGVGITSDAAGNIVVIGQFDGKIDWNGMIMNATGVTDTFVVRIKDTDWTPMLGAILGDADDQAGWAIAAQGDGSFAIAGAFRTALVVTPSEKRTAVGGLDSFVAKFTP